ncbi:phosphoadenylyl-sulfate reductase [Thiothrix fructosivorans]|uniref:Adenosine 5'-phosphosulfate reductase n=1 Tax=Thiothrix fructosivorans TaxID=111770 RepID=A0A8B0SP05_9GAMM|nr:phosphoadenylyl-sulfate reductase [Thiothrix fructosivorans]MBO0612779.1 phosphoadenylyl-sulfate reductase [Thiothrix fructosivorans]QTX11758.1 phosphoadenylyl-sulfate reductase [Thiothrix fructosivorans]
MTLNTAPLQTLHADFAELTLDEALIALRQRFEGKITFSTSFGLEDQVITDAIFRNGLDIEVFTLDTGRNFKETYDTLDATRNKYGKQIKTYYPDTAALEHYVTIKGINAIYESVENRKECCTIRKIEPLNRALKGAQVWITGLRAAQSSFRADMNLFETDAQRELIKFNPLLNATSAQLWGYIRQYAIPYNPLHGQGFPSIGCAPCTRAITEGEDERAGRWWWESHNQECGLHDGTHNPLKKAA